MNMKSATAVRAEEHADFFWTDGGDAVGKDPNLEVGRKREYLLVLDGNGANVAKHCVPSVSTDRVSITFRRIGAKINMSPFEGPHGRQSPPRR